MTISRPIKSKPNKIRTIINRLTKKNSELNQIIGYLQNDYQATKNDIVRLNEENSELRESENRHKNFSFFLFLFSIVFIFSFLSIFLIFFY